MPSRSRRADAIRPRLHTSPVRKVVDIDDDAPAFSSDALSDLHDVVNEPVEGDAVMWTGGPDEVLSGGDGYTSEAETFEERNERIRRELAAEREADRHTPPGDDRTQRRAVGAL